MGKSTSIMFLFLSIIKRELSTSFFVLRHQNKMESQKKKGHLLDQTRALFFIKMFPIIYGQRSFSLAHNLLSDYSLEYQVSRLQWMFFLPSIQICQQVAILNLKSLGVSHLSMCIIKTGKNFDPKALRCVFVGYSSTQKGYKCFHPPSKKIFVSRDVTFHQEESYFTKPYLQGRNFRENVSIFLVLS